MERLRRLIGDDLHALPDIPEPEPVSDDDSAGGVSLGADAGLSRGQPDPVEEPSKQATVEPPNNQNNAAYAPSEATTRSDENEERRFVWQSDLASSYNLGTSATQHPPATPAAPAAPSGLGRGELAPSRLSFTPIVALSKYPYRFCNKSISQDIASAFFDAGKFWAREWDLYYVWDIDTVKPLVLVREEQFQALLKEINLRLKLNLKITDEQREESLVSRFPDHPRCHPRYLGRSHTKDEYETMSADIPDENFQAKGERPAPPLDGRTLEDFKQQMEEMWELQKNKSKAQKQRKMIERLGKQRTMMDMFKRAQRYLGLRPTSDGASGQLAQGQVEKVPPVDPELPVPFIFDQSIVFVCVDVEAYERAHHIITEIGIATLDTRELQGVPPGVDGVGWRSKIRARHLRIRENKHLVNGEFVSGCPERFDFGTSEIVSLADAPMQVAACFNPPFGAAVFSQNVSEPLISLLDDIGSSTPRKVVLLGHDTLTDIKYLQDLGYDPLKHPYLVESLDSAILYRVWKQEQNITKLGNILYDFDIVGWNLHNAGNDAVFTLQAMLAVCVREATLRDSEQLAAMREADKAGKLAVLEEEARQKAQDDAAGWSDGEPNDDGGAPVPVVMPKPKVLSIQPQGGASTGRGHSHGFARGGNTPQEVAWLGNVEYNSSNDGRGRGRPRTRVPSEQGGQGHSIPRGHFQSESRGSSRGRGRGRGRSHGASASVDRGPTRQARDGDSSVEPKVSALLVDLS
ncbi:hypothetical protein P154DRAFT_422772 [Amniculicola lignicola CBS 123094]|uniref:Gfd2/YDR514C-like C-terminal domain-containing protein n=1 Tax=Amniculicola lignicola CBS 123094 TaxID=1392246 RepID=A0A6A5WWN5_9PLEO|nr:hypothetical protein P154DRAFT_422772 [Amniculicola lignicola CBS 123094]